MGFFSEIFGLLIPTTRYKISYAKHCGIRDAGANLPIFESIDDIADRMLAIESIAEDYPGIPMERELLIEWLRVKQRNFLGYLSELRNLAEEALSETMALIHRADARLKAQWISTIIRFREAEEDLLLFDKLYPSYHRGRFISQFGYNFFLVLAAVADVPFNMFAFRIFRETELFTFVISVVVGTIIPLTAHWIGAALRQPIRNKIDKNLMIVSTSLVIVAILGIGLVRESYLKSIGQSSDIVITVLFVFLQYLFFGLAIYLAYGAHDTRQELSERKDYLLKEADKLNTMREKLREKMHTEFKNVYSIPNILLAEYAKANSNAGGPLSSTSIKNIKVERPKVELKEVDCDIPDEFNLTLKKDVEPIIKGINPEEIS